MKNIKLEMEKMSAERLVDSDVPSLIFSFLEKINSSCPLVMRGNFVRSIVAFHPVGILEVFDELFENHIRYELMKKRISQRQSSDARQIYNILSHTVAIGGD